MLGCNLAYDVCGGQAPTDTEGNVYTLTASCTATQVSDSRVKTEVYTAVNIAGGTRDSVSEVGSGVSFLILEIKGVNTVDQKLCGVGSTPGGGGTASSGSVTTTHAGELVMGVGTAIYFGFRSSGAGWTAITVGSQIAEYQTSSSPGTYSATAGVNGGADTTWNMIVLSYYQASSVNSPAVSEISLSPPTVVGGVSLTGTVTLSGAAPSGGAVIALSSSTPSATVPASVTIAAGASSATFTVTTSAVSASVSVNISGSYNETKSATLTVNPPAPGAAITAIILNPASVMGGVTNPTGTVTLNTAAPTGGLTASLSSDNSVATVPATVTIPAGQTVSSNFTVTTQAVASTATAHISASLNGGTQSATLTVNALGSPTVNFSSGFGGQSTLTLNGGVAINGTRLRLTDGGSLEGRSAFYSTPVNVQTFTNNFSFQLTNAVADGFTFTIQGVGANALGPAGGGLGYGPDSPGGTSPNAIGKSVAVKFDLYSNAGEGGDSTGAYMNGASPTTPAFDMTGSGVDLHSGDVMNVQMSYDGTTLIWTITDTTTGKNFKFSWGVNIPSVVGGNTAYVGFTAGTGGLTAIQEILSWSYSPGSSGSGPGQSTTSTPAISPAAGSYGSPLAVTITDSTTGATIYYTTNGSIPTTSSTRYTGAFQLTTSATVQAMAVATGFTNSAVASTAYTVQSGAPVINFSSGFAGQGTLTMNGGAAINGSRLRLTDGSAYEGRSAFYSTPVNVQTFTNNFSFQLTSPIADGFTFTIQGVGANALGPAGGGLGYGPDSPGGTSPNAISKSVAVKFDLYSNAGEGGDSTGVYTNGPHRRHRHWI